MNDWIDNTCEFPNERRLLILVLWSVKNTEYPIIDSVDRSFIHFGCHFNSVAFRRYTTCVNVTWWKTYAGLPLAVKSIKFTILKALQIIPHARKLILYSSSIVTYINITCTIIHDIVKTLSV